MTGPGRQERSQVRRVLGVVENDQPTADGTAAQLLKGGRSRLRRVIAGLDPEPRRQFREPQADRLGLFGVYPPYDVVIILEAMRVLQGHLCFSDTTKAIQCLRDDDRPALARKIPVQDIENGLPPGEINIPVRHIPYPGYARN